MRIDRERSEQEMRCVCRVARWRCAPLAAQHPGVGRGGAWETRVCVFVVESAWRLRVLASLGSNCARRQKVDERTMRADIRIASGTARIGTLSGSLYILASLGSNCARR